MNGVARSGTQPVRGLQYSISPSLPAVVKGAVHRSDDTGRSASSSTSPAAKELSPLPHGTLKLYDTYFSKVEAPLDRQPPTASSENLRVDKLTDLQLPDSLACIGPSARRLLQLDEAQRRCSGKGPPPSKSSFARYASGQLAHDTESLEMGTATTVATTPAYYGNPLSVRPSGAMRRTDLSGSKSNQNGFTVSSTPTGSVRVSRPPTQLATPRQVTLFEATANRQATHDAAAVNPKLSSTIVRSAADAVPPLVHRLQRYIRKEVLLHSQGVEHPSPADLLGPYREAFGAIIQAFPAYAELLDDIRSTYDNVIQAQAELLATADMKVNAGEVDRLESHDAAAALRRQMATVETQLSEARQEIETRLAAEAKKAQEPAQAPRTGRPTDTLELRRDLEHSQLRVDDLERQSKDDLQKILILIGAVRECDRRLKEYEKTVSSISGQVSELDEFKRIAGEAQADLQRYKEKYSAYVPSSDFVMMRDYLSGELEVAQLLARRWRRTAAVRGTQMEVMERRLELLEEERSYLVSSVEEEQQETSPERAARALTPRPSWSKIQEKVPSLAEYTADLGFNTTSYDRSQNGAADVDLTLSTSGNRLDAANALMVVKGPSETSLRVEFLVSRIEILQQRVLQLEKSNVSDLLGVSSSEQITAFSPRSGETASTPLPSPKRTTITRSGSRQQMNASCDSFVAQQAVRQLLASSPPPNAPLLGPGFGDDIPVYLRCSGILTRKRVPLGTSLQLVYHFFLDVLPTFLARIERPANPPPSQQEEQENVDERSLQQVLYDYLHDEMAVREDLQIFEHAVHFITNWKLDMESRDTCNDAARLLFWVAQGLLPPRIAIDAAVVVSQVQRDLLALAKEQQSSRLRRTAISECLQPVLELKTSDELEQLGASLGTDSTFAVATICSDSHIFVQTLFLQECRAGVQLYMEVMSLLTYRSSIVTSKTERIGSVAVAEGDRIISLADVAAAIKEAEPQTPAIVTRELSENAVNRQATSAGDAAPTKAGSTASLPLEKVNVRLSDVVKAIGVAPIIRRTPQTAKEKCVL